MAKHPTWYKKFKRFLAASAWPWWFSFFVYLSLTFTSLATGRHLLLNFEPYPDGLYHTVPAWRATHGQGFTTGYQQLSELHPRVLPLYPVVLAIGYLVEPAPEYFYLTNLVLGSLTLLGLYLVLKEWGTRPLESCCLLLWYVLLAHVIWLPTLPMAENLGLPLLVFGLYGATAQKITHKEVALVLLSSTGLFFTKYTMILPALVLVLAIYARLLRQKKWSLLGSISGWYVMSGALFVVFHLATGFDPRQVFAPRVALPTAAIQPPSFFSLSYVLSNIMLYGLSFVGYPAPFLWIFRPVVSGLTTLLAFLGVAHALITPSKFKSVALFRLSVLGGVFLAQLPLVLTFYTPDFRYLILSLPLLLLSLWFWLQVPLPKPVIFVALGLGMLSSMWLQKSFWREIVVANWLQRSTAWQYQAVIKITDFIETNQDKKTPYVITALPPLYFELYGSSKYRVLPVSTHQEFAQHRVQAWGKDVPVTNLSATYHRLLSSGTPVYLSNAYITSQANIISDFEALKKEFSVNLVQSGCQETCNIYQLSELTVPTAP